MLAIAFILLAVIAAEAKNIIANTAKMFKVYFLIMLKIDLIYKN
jgi:hypothetical protein